MWSIRTFWHIQTAWERCKEVTLQLSCYIKTSKTLSVSCLHFFIIKDIFNKYVYKKDKWIPPLPHLTDKKKQIYNILFFVLAFCSLYKPTCKHMWKYHSQSECLYNSFYLYSTISSPPWKLCNSTYSGDQLSLPVDWSWFFSSIQFWFETAMVE